MARSITTAFKNSIKAQAVQPFFAVQLEFSTGSLYFWTGYGNLTMTATRQGDARTIGLRWLDGTHTFDIYNLSTSGVTWNADLTYVAAPGAPTIKAESGDGTVANFRNNPTSTEGYLGFSRQGSLRPGSAGGSSAQGGYVQIFF